MKIEGVNGELPRGGEEGELRRVKEVDDVSSPVGEE
jgi:hypothetical protein